ncbi:hypothetical protein B194_4950 [Serratia plymuthica A30]|nr:hypothetical protein B194_4950 [Serratia plymuthica A30]
MRRKLKVNWTIYQAKDSRLSWMMTALCLLNCVQGFAC